VHSRIPDFLIDIRRFDPLHAVLLGAIGVIDFVWRETSGHDVFHHGPAPLPLRLRQFLQLVAGPTDGEALVVEQIPDPADHQHFMVLVVASVAASLHGTQLGELLLPITQNVRLHATQLTDLTDREVTLGRNRWKHFLH
jgi:hypothetical protein